MCFVLSHLYPSPYVLCPHTWSSGNQIAKCSKDQIFWSANGLSLAPYTCSRGACPHNRTDTAFHSSFRPLFHRPWGFESVYQCLVWAYVVSPCTVLTQTVPSPHNWQAKRISLPSTDCSGKEKWGILVPCKLLSLFCQRSKLRPSHHLKSFWPPPPNPAFLHRPRTNFSTEQSWGAARIGL